MEKLRSVKIAGQDMLNKEQNPDVKVPSGYLDLS